MCHCNFISSYAGREIWEQRSVCGCGCGCVCSIQLKDLGYDWMEGFIPLPSLPKEREQESGQKHLWPTTPVITPTLPVIQGLSGQRTMGIWCQHQSKSTGRWPPSCHHPEDIRAFVFPVSHPPGGSYQVCNLSFFTFLLIFSYCMLCYETKWRLFSEWFWLSPCPDWEFYLGLLCFHPWVPKKSLLTVKVLLQYEYNRP